MDTQVFKARVQEVLQQFVGRLMTPNVIREAVAMLTPIVRVPDRNLRPLVTMHPGGYLNFEIEEGDDAGRYLSDYRGKPLRFSDIQPNCLAVGGEIRDGELWLSLQDISDMVSHGWRRAIEARFAKTPWQT